MQRPQSPQPVANTPTPPARFPELGVDIQQELNTLEEMILDSPRVPLMGKTMVNEEELLDQLDLIRLNLPGAFQAAQEVLRRRDEIIQEAEDYGRRLIDLAQGRAAELTDELGIVRQAELESQQIRQQVRQECDQLRDQVMAEVEQIRRKARTDLDEMRKSAMEDSQQIQRGADEYADRILGDMEHQLGDLLRVIRNGRSQLNLDK